MMRNMIRRSSEQRRASQEIQNFGTHMSFDSRVTPASPLSLEARRFSGTPLTLEQRRGSMSPSSLDGRRWSFSPITTEQKRGSISSSPCVRTFGGYCFPSRRKSDESSVYKACDGSRATSSTVTFCVVLMSVILVIVLIVSYYKISKFM